MIYQVIAVLIMIVLYAPITLTPEGGLYVQALQKVKMDMLDFHRQLTDLTELRTGKLVIGTSAFCTTNLLPQVIREFIKVYAGLILKWTDPVTYSQFFTNFPAFFLFFFGNRRLYCRHCHSGNIFFYIFSKL